MLQLLNHLDAAYNLARWLTQNEHDAEDIVQDAYLRAIRHFGSFHGGEGRAWLLTIVRNRCYDSARHKGVRERTTPFVTTRAKPLLTQRPRCSKRSAPDCCRRRWQNCLWSFAK